MEPSFSKNDHAILPSGNLVVNYVFGKMVFQVQGRPFCLKVNWWFLLKEKTMPKDQKIFHVWFPNEKELRKVHGKTVFVRSSKGRGREMS